MSTKSVEISRNQSNENINCLSSFDAEELINPIINISQLGIKQANCISTLSESQSILTLYQSFSFPDFLFDITSSFRRPSPHFWVKSVIFTDVNPSLNCYLINTPTGSYLWNTKNHSQYFSIDIGKRIAENVLFFECDGLLSLAIIDKPKEMIFIPDLMHPLSESVKLNAEIKTFGYFNGNIIIITSNKNVFLFSTTEKTLNPVKFPVLGYLNPFRDAQFYDSQQIITTNEYIYGLSFNRFSVFTTNDFSVISSVSIPYGDIVDFKVCDNTAFLLYKEIVVNTPGIVRIINILSNPEISNSNDMLIPYQNQNMSLTPVSQYSCCICTSKQCSLLSISGISIEVNVTPESDDVFLHSTFHNGCLHFLTSKNGEKSVELSDPEYLSKGTPLLSTLLRKYSLGIDIKEILESTAIGINQWICFDSSVVNESIISIKKKNVLHNQVLQFCIKEFSLENLEKLAYNHQKLCILENASREESLYKFGPFSSADDVLIAIKNNSVKYCGFLHKIFVESTNSVRAVPALSQYAISSFLRSQIVQETLECVLANLDPEQHTFYPDLINDLLLVSDDKNIANLYVHQLFSVFPDKAESIAFSSCLYSALAKFIHINRNYSVCERLYHKFGNNVIPLLLDEFEANSYFSDIIEIGELKEWRDVIIHRMKDDNLISGFMMITKEKSTLPKAASFFLKAVTENNDCDFTLDQAACLVSIGLLCAKFSGECKDIEIKLFNRILVYEAQKSARIGDGNIMKSNDIIDFFIGNDQKGTALSIYACTYDDRSDIENSEKIIQILQMNPKLEESALVSLLIDTGACAVIPDSFENCLTLKTNHKETIDLFISSMKKANIQIKH